MSDLTGNLARHHIALMVQPLVEVPNLSGTLKVQRAALRREFTFKNGALVAACSNDPHEHLAQVLAELKMLEAEQSAVAYEAAERNGVALGAFLVQRGLISRDRLVEALRFKAKETFFDCYTWESGQGEFTTWPVGELRGIGFQLDLGPLHRDAMDRLREWQSFRRVFPSLDATFEVDRDRLWALEEPGDDALLEKAEEGSPLRELLNLNRWQTQAIERRVLRLQRQGVLTARADEEPSEPSITRELLNLAIERYRACDFQRACTLAAEALERSPSPEAQAVYHDAELQMGLSISDEILALEGQLTFEPLPHPAPASLTVDDLYLYSKLQSSPSVRLALRSAAMGEIGAYRSVQRLMACGVVRTTQNPPVPRCKTDPFGFPAVT